MRADTTAPMPLALSVRDAARVLSISERTLRSLVKEGRVPFVRLGGSEKSRIVFPTDVLRDWLKREAGASQTTENGQPQREGGEA